MPRSMNESSFSRSRPGKHGVLTRGLVAALAVVAGAGVPGCGGPGSAGAGGCHYEAWQGRCRLVGVRTARMIDRFPKAFVVVEATYEPVTAGGVFAPPSFRTETFAPAESEMDLKGHLQASAEVDCSVQSPVGDPCAPKMQASVPEFVPQATQAATGPVGCGKIEHSAGTVPVPSNVSLPGPFQFDDGSSGTTPDVLRVADEAARIILQNPRIECVAIKGQSAPGESFSLANDRAQAVRHLLESRGIEHTRVTVFESSAPSYTASPDDQPVPAEHRRVHLAVVVYGGGP